MLSNHHPYPIAGRLCSNRSDDVRTPLGAQTLRVGAMSLSDLFNISRTVRRDKAQQQDLLPVPSSSTPARLCNICYAQPAAYNCPRCNIPYCSLVCFRRKEHQECSQAFSSSAISLESRSNGFRVEEGERRKVVDILGRLEGREREAKERREDDSSDEDEDGDAAGVREGVTAEQIEGASTEALLDMLTAKERQKFLQAVKDPEQAQALMQRLDRKAERRAVLDMPPQEQGALVVPALPADNTLHPTATRREWQALPWFEKPESSPNLFGIPSSHIASFVSLLDGILSAGSPASKIKDQPAPVDLSYNLCAVLMAYTYTLRKMDLESLTQISMTVGADGRAREAEVIPSDAARSNLEHAATEYDEEPPPLEPDSPTLPAATLSDLAVTPTVEPHPVQDSTLAADVLEEITRLLPFVFQQPPPSSSTSVHRGSTDHSRLLLSSLDDASMWLLSRLSLESEIGPGGADALSLQLLEDLAKLLHREQLVPTFSADQEVEPKYRLAAQLASLSPQQAFAAAQTPLLLNAVADLYFFLERVHDTAPDSLASSSIKPKSIKLAQRKLGFYLCNAILGGHSPLAEVQASIQTLRIRMDMAKQADKLAAAVNLIDKDHAIMSTHPGIAEQD